MRAFPSAVQRGDDVPTSFSRVASLLLWAAFDAIPYAGAAAVWGVVVLASAALLMIIPARLAKRRIGRADAVSLLLLALSSGPLVTGISVGQAALPAVAAVGVAVLCAARRRWLPMALATIVAGVLKPNDALVIAATVRELPALFVVAGSAIVSVLANASVAHGIRGIIAYLHVILNQGASERVYAYQFTPTSIAYGFGMARQAAETRGTVLSVAAIGTIVATIRLTRANLVDGAAIACAAFPFVLPFEHEPDMVIALLPALLVVFRARGRTWALGAAGTVLLCTNPFALTQGWPGDRFRQIEIELTDAAPDSLLDDLGDELRLGAGQDATDRARFIDELREGSTLGADDDVDAALREFDGELGLRMRGDARKRRDKRSPARQQLRLLVAGSVRSHAQTDPGIT
jgi:hypothetical protein